MKESLISLEAAKLLKEKGFVDFSKSPDSIPIIPQSLAQKWLREVHKIYVWPLLNIESNLFGYEIWDANKGVNISYSSNCKDWDFNSYEQALEAGILKSLKLVKST